MRVAPGVVLLAALLVPVLPGPAADPTADDLLRAVEAKLRAVTEKTGGSIACVVVSRSDQYPKPMPQEHAGHLGGFDKAAFLQTDNSKSREALAKKLDLSDPETIPAHGWAGGVVIDAGGFVLTTYHAVEGATKVYVHLPGGRGSYADVHAADFRSDLAVLRLPAPPPGLKPVPLGEVRTGDPVVPVPGAVAPGKLLVMMAYPYSSGFKAQQATAWLGSVGAVVRPKNDERQALSRSWYLYGTLLEFNTLFQPGGKNGGVASNLVTNGAAVLGLDGELLGLTTTSAGIVGPLDGPVYVLPLDPNLRRIVDVLRRGEEVEYGLLGVIVSQDQGFGANALYLSGVTPRGPAAQAGITTDDAIVRINGYPVRRYADLLLYAGTAVAGSKLKVRVRSPQGTERDVTVTLAKFRNESPYLASVRPDPVFGLRVDYGSVLAQSGGGLPRGVAVRELVPGSPAAEKFKALGDGGPGRWAVTRVNGADVATPADFYAAARGQPSVKLLLTDLADPNQPTREITLP